MKSQCYTPVPHLAGRLAALEGIQTHINNEIKQITGKLSRIEDSERREQAFYEQHEPEEEMRPQDTQAASGNPMYHEGDELTFRIGSGDVYDLNDRNVDRLSLHVKQIVAVKKAPEPVVLWCNVYSECLSSGYHSEYDADFCMGKERIAKLKITITGCDVKAEVIPVEGV